MINDTLIESVVGECSLSWTGIAAWLDRSRGRRKFLFRVAEEVAELALSGDADRSKSDDSSRQGVSFNTFSRVDSNIRPVGIML
jgi:hypothetical protein